MAKIASYTCGIGVFMSMAWKEFKETVDEILAEKDSSEYGEIWYIDISFPGEDAFERGILDVSLDECLGIVIQ